MNSQELKSLSLRLLLRPLLRYCLRHAIKLQEVVETVKALLVSIAEEQLTAESEEVNASRISLMTGVHRKDVSRLLGASEPSARKPDLITRVLGKWQGDERFLTKSGRTRALTWKGPDSDFAQLVAAVSRELNHTTVLNELERSGAVVRQRSRVALRSGVFVSKDDLEQGLRYLAEDLDDLIIAVEENVFQQAEPRNLHIKTEYDRIPTEHAAALREWLLEEGTRFHARVRKHFSKFDEDMREEAPPAGTYVRAAFGTFSRIERNSNESDGSESND